MDAYPQCSNSKKRRAPYGRNRRRKKPEALLDGTLYRAYLYVELQWVLDDIMAFRGSYCENIADSVLRNVINTGTSIERLSLYLRLGQDAAVRRRELSKLLNRLYKSHLYVNQGYRNYLIDHVLNREEPTGSVADQLQCVEHLLAEL